MAEKRLIIIVDGTTQMGPHWNTILNCYLEKIIRHFCRNDSTTQDLSASKPALALIAFGAHGPYNVCKVQASTWTRDMDKFLKWLSTLSFNGGGFDEAGISEGLSNALEMFQRIPNVNAPQKFGKWHCILVAATNPNRVHTQVQVPFPILDSGESSKSQMESHPGNAAAVARSFIPLFISMSIISPKNFPRFKDIYNAGNNHQQVAESSVKDAENPNSLVLLSENFLEAYVALSHHLFESKPKSGADRVTSFPVCFSDEEIKILQELCKQPLPGQHEILAENISTALPNAENEKFDDDEDITLLQEVLNEFPSSEQENCTGNIPTEIGVQEMVKENSEEEDFLTLCEELSESWKCQPTIRANDFRSLAEELESYSGKSKEHEPAFQQCNGSESVSNEKTASNFFSSPSNFGFEDFKMELTPSGIVLMQNSPHQSSETVNANLTSNLTPQRAEYTVNEPIELQRMGSFKQGQSRVMPSINISDSKVKTSKGANYTIAGSFPYGTFNINGKSVISQPLANHQEHSLKRSHSNAFALPGLSNVLGAPFLMMGKSQEFRRGIDCVCGANNFSSNTKPQQITRALPDVPHSDYVKIWEGDLTSKENGKLVFVNRLVAYRKKKASSMLGTNWPPRLHIDQLISQNHMNNLPYEGEVDYLIFEAMNHHGKLGQLKEKRLCAYIKLPPQTLILSDTTTKLRFIGTLYHEGFPLYEHQIYNSPS